MSLLDDAQKIKQAGPYLVEGSHCLMCYAVIVGFAHIKATGHGPDCPWLSMTKIVAALEAAQAVVDRFDETPMAGRVDRESVDFHVALEDLCDALGGAR